MDADTEYQLTGCGHCGGVAEPKSKLFQDAQHTVFFVRCSRCGLRNSGAFGRTEANDHWNKLMAEMLSREKLTKLIKRWRRDAGEYQDNVNEARAKGLPHDQMLSMTTALNDCADQLEKLLK